MQRLAFLAFGKREDLVYVASRSDSDGIADKLSCLALDKFLHVIPLGIGDLVLQQPDGTDIEAGRKDQLATGEQGQLGTTTAYIDIKIGMIPVEVFCNMVLVNKGGFAAAADDLDGDT